MGKEDRAAKRYLSDPERFADLFNHTVYGGEGTIDPADLRVTDTSSTSEGAEKRRDILKEWAHMSDGEATYAILGLEEQTHGHPAMPVRCALYDAMAYGEQISALVRKNKREGMDGASAAEFLSGLWERDRLRPVITLVLYLSPDDWTWPETLHGVIDAKAEGQLMTFAPDYRMNLVAPARIPDGELDSYSTGVGPALKYIKHSSDRKNLVTMVHEDARFGSLDLETALFLNIVTGSNLRIEPEGGRVDMCKAIDDMRAEERLEGKLEGKLEVLVALVRDRVLTACQAAERAKLSEAEFKALTGLA